MLFSPITFFLLAPERIIISALNFKMFVVAVFHFNYLLHEI